MFIISKRYSLCISEILPFKIFVKKKHIRNHDSRTQISFLISINKILSSLYLFSIIGFAFQIKNVSLMYVMQKNTSHQEYYYENYRSI